MLMLFNVAISETWFTKHIPDSCVEINGYSLIRKDRNNRKGGGVCFYIKHGISFEECIFPSFNVSLEIKWIRVTYNSSAYFIACCYYPPNPRHTADDFIHQLQSDLDSIMCNSDCCTVIITGDFNRLDTSFLEHDFGLTQCVQDITHAQSILDKFFCSHPFEYRVTVYKSCLKTKHKAVLATGYQVTCNMQSSSRKKFVVFK